MSEFIFKLIFLWEKKMHLTRIRCEKNYVLERFGNLLAIDEGGLRSELAKLRAIKQPKEVTKEKILEIERKINEVQFYKNMYQKGKTSEKELLDIIKYTKLFR
jgi:hypothetical protein